MVSAAALVLKDEVGKHYTGHGNPNGLDVRSSPRGLETDLKRFIPNIEDRVLSLTWSQVAKLILDDDFYNKYVDRHTKPETPKLTEIKPTVAAAGTTALTDFDYGELNETEADKLRKIEETVKTETACYFTILGANFKAAQELLANHSGGTFERWYTSLGFKRQTVYRLIRRYDFMCSPKLGEHKADVFEELPLALSYEISKPSAPPELVDKVLDGDITSHAEYQKLLKEKGALEERCNQLAANVVVEKQEVIPDGYVSPEEHREALDKLEKRSKQLTDEIMRLKASQNAEKTGKLAAQIAELEEQLKKQQNETKTAYGKASKAAYDSETKDKALEEARQKNAELEKRLAELKQAEQTDPDISEKLFRIHKRSVTSALTGFVVFAVAPENKAYRAKAIEVLESYLNSLKEDKNG